MTKAELEAALQENAKLATELQTIANVLNRLLEEQKNGNNTLVIIKDSFKNGFQQNIIKQVTDASRRNAKSAAKFVILSLLGIIGAVAALFTYIVILITK